MFRKLSLAFILIPLIELALLIMLSKVISGWGTLLIVIATGLLGAALTKSQGLRALVSFKSGQSSPTEAAGDGVLILIAGIVLITPGVLTDVLGFALLTPAVRRNLRKHIADRAKNSGHFSTMGFGFPGTGPKTAPQPYPQPSAQRGGKNSGKKASGRPTVIDV